MSAAAPVAVERHGNVVARRVADDAILLDLRNGRFFDLNGVGARIWDLLETRRSIDALVEVIVAEYDVSEEAAKGDVLRLVDELRRFDLVRVCDDAESR